MRQYISNSKKCMDSVVPGILNSKVKEYEKSQANKIRSMRVLYESGLLEKRKYTSIRNSSDKAEIIPGVEVPKIIPYKNLMSFLKTIDVGELRDLQTLATELSTESVPGVYRPLKPYLLKLADLYMDLHRQIPMLHWFHGEEGLFWVAIGADGAPFGKDDFATAYLVSFLNLLNRVQSCNENHLLLGANCEEDHPLMKAYIQQLTKEMEEVENEVLTTEKGYQVRFAIKLIASDMKWASSFSGELNNAATYFSPFANVSQSNKHTMFGSIGGSDAIWQPWSYEKRLEVARKVQNFKKRLKDPDKKQRGEVTKFIAQTKSRQEFVPPLGKFVSLIKPDPLHRINNGWQQWFTHCLTVAMQHTNPNKLKAAVVLSDLPTSCPLVTFFNCVKERIKCGRLYKNFCRWFSEERKKGLQFSYRFTGLESKRFCWNFGLLIEVLLGIANISSSIKVKLHALAFSALQL
ncbi:unnamed protein product [Porites lobata]|uniref:Uncharacterized protein n=1 Tax=Porites lobata TaxID=104759 RepID=A0ABN8Q1Z8_9CNID|nr:unnamed protein product [Porites lobata]